MKSLFADFKSFEQLSSVCNQIHQNNLFERFTLHIRPFQLIVKVIVNYTIAVHQTLFGTRAYKSIKHSDLLLLFMKLVIYTKIMFGLCHRCAYYRHFSHTLRN